MWLTEASRGAPASDYLRASQTRPENDEEGDLGLGRGCSLIQPCRPPGDARSPGHAGIEEIRGGAGGGGGDLLGLFLLFPLAANVAERTKFCTPAGAEAGASAGSNELSVERPGPCSLAFRSWPPLPHSRRRCPGSRCIKDLKRSPPSCPPDSAAGAAVRAGRPSPHWLRASLLTGPPCMSTLRVRPAGTVSASPPKKPNKRSKQKEPAPITMHSVCPSLAFLPASSSVLLPPRYPPGQDFAKCLKSLFGSSYKPF